MTQVNDTQGFQRSKAFIEPQLSQEAAIANFGFFKFCASSLTLLKDIASASQKSLWRDRIISKLVYGDP